jgi:hypothetical protein
MPLVRQALTAGVGQILVQAEDFRKKVMAPAYPAFACALKTRRSPALKPFRLFRSGA